MHSLRFWLCVLNETPVCRDHPGAVSANLREVPVAHRRREVRFGMDPLCRVSHRRH